MTPAPLTVRSLAGFTDGVGSKVTLGAHATGHPSRVLVTPAVSWSPCRPAISEGARAAGQAELVAQRAAPSAWAELSATGGPGWLGQDSVGGPGWLNKRVDRAGYGQ